MELCFDLLHFLATRCIELGDCIVSSTVQLCAILILDCFNGLENQGEASLVLGTGEDVFCFSSANTEGPYQFPLVDNVEGTLPTKVLHVGLVCLVLITSQHLQTPNTFTSVECLWMSKASARLDPHHCLWHGSKHCQLEAECALTCHSIRFE